MQSLQQTRKKQNWSIISMDAALAPPKKITEGDKNGNLLTCPGLNNQQLLKHLPPSIATSLRYMDQERKNPQTTKQVKSELELD